MAERYEDMLIALRRIMRATDIYSRQLSKHSGLTTPQLLILQAIRDCGDVTIGTIARQVSLSQATVTTILDRLESRGMTYRERSTEDKRKVHAHLTEAGEKALREAPTPLQQSFVERFGGLAEWEQSMITSALQRVADMMDAGDIDASPLLHLGYIEHPVDSAAPDASSSAELATDPPSSRNAAP
ncbi:MAG: MarR family transcriptional regulator [Pseudomonadales bacterium]|nr:MarR family transcriptional regulator [Pseudomonadales bacterium]